VENELDLVTCIDEYFSFGESMFTGIEKKFKRLIGDYLTPQKNNVS